MEAQAPQPPALADYPINIDCDKIKKPKYEDPECIKEELCGMIDGFNKSTATKKKVNPSPSVRGNKKYPATPQSIQNNNDYNAGIRKFNQRFEAAPANKKRDFFGTDCQYENWKAGKAQAFSPDHTHDASLGGAIAGQAAQKNLSFATRRINTRLGGCMRGYKPAEHGKCVANENCGCAS